MIRLNYSLSPCWSGDIESKFDDFRFSRSSDKIGAPKFCNGSHDLTKPQSGTVCHP